MKPLFWGVETVPFFTSVSEVLRPHSGYWTKQGCAQLREEATRSLRSLRLRLQRLPYARVLMKTLQKLQNHKAVPNNFKSQSQPKCILARTVQHGHLSQSWASHPLHVI